MDFILIWCALMLVFGAIGFAIGQMEPGNGALGGLLGILLGPIGFVVIILLNQSKKSSRERAEALEFQRMAAARAEREAREQREAARAPMTNVRVRREGKVLGSYAVYQIKEELEAGRLAWEDEYFDPAQKGWVQLAGHPEV